MVQLWLGGESFCENSIEFICNLHNGETKWNGINLVEMLLLLCSDAYGGIVRCMVRNFGQCDGDDVDWYVVRTTSLIYEVFSELYLSAVAISLSHQSVKWLF